MIPGAGDLMMFGGAAVGDPYFANVSLLMHMDGADNGTTFTDVKGNTANRYGAAVTKTPTKQFGTASLYCPSGSYLVLANVPFAFGLDAFTVEFWVNITTTVDAWPFVLASAPDAASGGFYMTIDGPTTGWGGVGKISFIGCSGMTYGPGLLSAASIRSIGWVHVAVCRSGVVTKMFINGVNDSTHTAAGVANYTASSPTVMSSSGAGGDGQGYIDDLRITKGVARYTANFTPSTAAFPDS